MTDNFEKDINVPSKQIIIDGVYVYECVNAKRSIFGIDMECRLGGDCSQNPNCYYKKLKRKEQECEELREQLAEIISQSALLPKFFGLTADEITNMLNQLNQLKAENDELKGIRDRNFLHALEEQKRADKLSKTLAEIKEIAKHELNNLTESAINGGRYVEILQKISECEVVDE